MRPVLILLTSIFVAVTLQASGLEYLNSLRQKAGLMPLHAQSNLDDAAQNHSDYMQLNGTTGHDEKSGNPGFTGAWPQERTVYAGYASRVVGENVSSGQESEKESIDDLFSAIYHRFGFLTLVFDEVGIGVSDDGSRYTYDLGSSAISDLCVNGVYSGGFYVYDICADRSKKIDKDRFLETYDSFKADAPEIVYWPPFDGEDIPPVFYEEHPDPLPSHSVTGYPVSVEFNDAKFTEPPKIESFTLEDETGNQLEAIILMERSNDPNGEFTGYQFAFFPKKRLEWGTLYYAEIVYSYKGSTAAKRWRFTTRSLQGKAERFYRIEQNGEISLDVLSGTTYAIYAVPKNTNDRLGGVRYRTTAETSFEYIDHNTFLVTLKGRTGDSARFTFVNGVSIILTVSDTDTATDPAHAVSLPQDTVETPEETGGDATQSEEESDRESADREATPDTNEDSLTPSEESADEGETNGTDSSADPNDGKEREQPSASNSQESGDGTDEGESEAVLSARIRVEEGTTGVYRDVEATKYGITDHDKNLYAQITDNGDLEYHVENSRKATTVRIEIPDSEVRIDHNSVATLILTDESDAEVTVNPDGSVEIRVGGTLRPKTVLPFGAQVEIMDGKIRSTFTMPEKLRF
jgi:hypothetical protein